MTDNKSTIDMYFYIDNQKILTADDDIVNAYEKINKKNTEQCVANYKFSQKRLICKGKPNDPMPEVLVPLPDPKGETTTKVYTGLSLYLNGKEISVIYKLSYDNNDGLLFYDLSSRLFQNS